MHTKVLKWAVPVNDQEHPIGTGNVLYVDTQGDLDIVFVWTYEVGSPNLNLRTARVFGTGQPIPPRAGSHIGSAQVGPFVWHVFDNWKGNDNADG